MGKTPDRITADNVKNLSGEASTKMLSKEEIEFPYECPICKKRFKTVQGRNGHMSTHRIETIDTEVESLIDDSEEDPMEWVKMYVKGRITNEEVIKILAAEEKVTFVIPEDPFDSKLNYLLGLNGQMFEYPIGQYIILPRSIVNQIKNTYKETELAKRRNLVERNKEVERALS